MAVVLVEGFDLYNGTTSPLGLRTKWVVGPTAPNGGFSMVAGRFGGQALRITSDPGSYPGVMRTLPGAYAAIGLGVAVKCVVMPTQASSNNAQLTLMSGTGYQLGLQIMSDGSIRVYRQTALNAGTALGTSAAGVIQSGVQHYLELGATIHDTTGTVEVKVDGAVVLSLTGQDTRNGTPTTVDKISFYQTPTAASGAGTIDWDDLYVVDSATTLGERRIEVLLPTSDVAQGFARSAGTANFSLVDEALANGDTDYVQGSVAGDVDTYGFANFSGTPTVIDAVQLSAFAMKTDAAARQIALQAKSGATTSDGGNYTLTSTYQKFERILETDPNTAAAWAAAAVNALEGGPKVTV